MSLARLPLRRHISRPLLLGTAVVAVLGGAIAAYAFFIGAGSGSSLSNALTVGAGQQPTATASGTSVTVNWTQATLADGTPVAAYSIKRYDVNGVAQTVNPNCAGTFPGLTCTENNVPSGTWTYTDTPFQNNWRGAESPRSAQVVVSSTTQTATTTSVASSANPSAFGQSVQFTATVAPASGTATPTGSVQFRIDNVNFGSASALVGGSATSGAIATLTVGTHTVVATYGGDTSFSGSQGSLVQTVNKDATTTVVSSAVNPSVYGQTVTMTAAVSANSPGSGVPSGGVTFKEGTLTLGTGTLSNGSATFATSLLSVGTHSITASYDGDGSYLASSSSALSQVVNKDSSTTTLTSSSNPSVFGQPVTFTATITANAPGNGNPGGSVTFADGTTTLATVSLSGGSASYTTSTLSVNAGHTIGASYGGDGNFLSSSTTISQAVNMASTMTSLSASTASSVFGQSVTFSATVSAVAPGAGTPSGTVSFQDGGAPIGSGTVDSAGHASFSTTALSVGSHTITAVYSGDGNFTGSTSSAVTNTVAKGGTTTSLGSAPNPSVIGQNVTFTATVTVTPPAAGTASGTVSFQDAGTAIGSGAVDSAGHASFSTTALSVGSHTITAVYSGDGNFNGSSSGTQTQVVNRAGTTTAVTSSLNPSTAGQNVTFTATVSVVSPGAGVPTGSVNFSDGSTGLGSGSLDSAGHASFSTSSLAAGTHTITAAYVGDGNFGNSSGSVVQSVNSGLTNTSTALMSSANPNLTGTNVTFTATVNPTPAAGQTITFKDGSTTLGTGTTNAAGSATFTTVTPLSLGDHPITAAYAGDASHSASTGSLTQHVTRILVSPTTAVANGTVTVTGAGWPANQTGIQVWLGPVGTGYFLGYANADASGNISQSLNVGQGIPHGSYTVNATDNGITIGGNTLTINPAITSRQPDHANPGNTVTLYGAGYTANSTVTVMLGTTTVTGSVTSSSSNGQVNNLQFTVPTGFAAGATTITMTDGGGNSASIVFTVYQASIAASPTSVTRPATVSVTGAGWPANQTGIQVWLGPVGTGYFLGYVSADASGNIGATNLTISTGIPPGTYTLNASDGAINVAGNQEIVN